MEINREFPFGVRGAGLRLVSGSGWKPTATSFVKDMATFGIKQIFRSYDNPKGTGYT